MDHCVNIPDSVIETPGILKIVNFDKIERGRTLRPGFHHCSTLGKCPGGAAHLEAAAQKLINHMSTDESGSTCYKDIFSAAQVT